MQSSAAIAHSGSIFIGSYDYHLYCLNGTTGHTLWKFSTQGQVDSSPALANGTVGAPNGDGMTACAPAFGRGKS